MKRREFITLLGGAAAARPLAARAQQFERKRRIGLLTALADDEYMRARINALLQGLQDLGWIEGRNFTIDYRFAASDSNRVRAYATELVGLAPDVIFTNNTPVLAALQQITSLIPIVFAGVADPVGQGFVASLARPGGNMTGFATNELATIGKMLEMLNEMVPAVTRAHVMFNPSTAPYVSTYLHTLRAVRLPSSVELVPLTVHVKDDIESAIAKLAREQGSGLIVPNDAFTIVHHRDIVRLAERYRVPAIYANRSFVSVGGLMSYGADPYDYWRRSGSYVDRILKGAKPADLPVQQPVKYELVVNLRTAKALGLDAPATLLALADEVIE
jgi:putative ABC transport system substrate-binding protein